MLSACVTGLRSAYFCVAADWSVSDLRPKLSVSRTEFCFNVDAFLLNTAATAGGFRLLLRQPQGPAAASRTWPRWAAQVQAGPAQVQQACKVP
jgi:hypothetical protein